MYLNHLSPLNAGVLRALVDRGKGKVTAAIELRAADDKGGYMNCGCHPDIVERVWNQLGPALPVNCRCMAYGTPALVAPRSGIVLAVAWGTQYILRLSDETAPLAIKAGATTTIKWSFGGSMDVTREFGRNWVFGCWLKEESEWCRGMYEEVEKHAAD